MKIPRRSRPSVMDIYNLDSSGIDAPEVSFSLLSACNFWGEEQWLVLLK